MSATAVGASVRGSLALERAVRGWALLHGRDYVVPTDVERLFVAVLGHRVVLTPDEARGGTPARHGRGHGRLRGRVPLACPAAGRRARRAAADAGADG